MSCSSCGQNIVNCGCNTPSSLNCCGDDENFIAETPDPAVPRKYPVPIEDAVIINSEVSLDCNSAPSSGCEALHGTGRRETKRDGNTAGYGQPAV